MVARAPVQTVDVVDIRLTYLPDGEAHFSPTGLFPGTDDAAWEAHSRWLDEDRWYVTSLGAFLIRTGDRAILVDLGFGENAVEVPGFAWGESGRLLTSLGEAGVRPEQVDTVLYTHMHADHTGWTTSGPDTALTFANARHLIGDNAEWQFWRDNPDAAFAPDAATVLDPLQDRIGTPDGEQFAPGVNLIATPGHTPGHQTVVVSSGAERAVILGDIMHCPAQLGQPEWSVVFDVDAELAKRTRDRLLAGLEGSDTVVGCGHFPEAAFGRVLRGQGKPLWQVG